jgi:hypothetical protein
MPAEKSRWDKSHWFWNQQKPIAIIPAHFYPIVLQQLATSVMPSLHSALSGDRAIPEGWPDSC